MATITTHEQHMMHSSISRSPEDSLTSTQPYGMDYKESTSPRSPRFPVHDADVQPSSGPLPNPHFVFPARQTPSSNSSVTARSAGRRPMSAFELQSAPLGMGRDIPRAASRSIPPPLPSFSFNPTSMPNGMTSPPQSPTSPSWPIPSRPGGHRRGGSEFIGGDGITGSGGLMSTSPTKTDGSLPSPGLQPTAGRRKGPGHAHRRSAAISCHDLSMVFKPVAPATSHIGGSAPNSPTGLDQHHSTFPGIATIATQDFPSADDESSLGSPSRASRTTRVGFSDTLEFIPRPLSLVSSDASSTATARQGHSVSGSLSSLISIGTVSPPSNQSRGLPSPVFSPKIDEVRPSTAGALLGGPLDKGYFDSRGSTSRSSSVPLTGDCSPASVESLTPKSKKHFFNFDRYDTARESSPTRSCPVSSSSSDKSRNGQSKTSFSGPDSRNDFDIPIASIEQPTEPARRPSLTKKSGKKQKKVKSWAGSILSRKARPRSQKPKALSRRSPTPPLRSYEPPEEVLDSAAAIDSIPEVVIPEEPSVRPSVQTDFANWKPRHVIPQDDSMSPIIDLDAALGPFNTPSGRDSDWEASQRSGSKKRPMHSAAGMKGFNGPGMHYHRRAESAPEMVAFDNPRFPLHHIGSSSTMEDVFEEDEEADEWEEVKTVSHKGSTIKPNDEVAGLGIDIKVEDADGSELGSVVEWNIGDGDDDLRGLKRKNSDLSESGSPPGSSMKSDQSPRVQTDRISFRDEASNSDVNLVDPVTSRPQSRSSPTLVMSQGAKDLAPADVQSLNSQPAYLTPTSQNSAFQSPFQSPFPSPRTPMSYEVPRIPNSQTSGIDESGFESMWLGEPGPEVRISVDVPSLTSSTSTMTRESMMNPAFGNPQFRTGQRSASLSGPTATRKRSSIASLSRLLNSSHGEKSKLSIEERAPGSPERKEKEGKGKRLSRMMQFWRAKDD